MAAVDVVNDYLHGLPGGVRRLAHAQCGLTIAAEALGEPLDVGLAIADGGAEREAPALGAGHELDPWTLFVVEPPDPAGPLWLHALPRDLGARRPVSAVDEPTLDRLLGLVVAAVVAARGGSH